MADFQCITVPSVDADLEIHFLGGGAFKGYLDFSQGLPTNCTVSFSLLTQLSAALGSVDCLLKIFNVIGALKDFIQSPLNPLKVKAVADAITALEPCIEAAIPSIGMLVTIQDSIKVVIQFLSCLVSELNSLIEARARIDFSVAVGNPKLQSILQCAQANIDVSAQTLLKSLGPIQPLLELLGSLPGSPGSLPSVSNLTVETDLQVVVNALGGIITTLQAVA